MLLLAGGTGLAPILSMLRKMRADGSQRKAHLIYGVSTDEDLVELDAARGDRRRLDRIHLGPLRVRPGQRRRNNKGYVTSLIRPEHLYDGDVAIYLCGPPPMVEAVRTHVDEAGIEPTGFYYEKFALAHAAAATRTGQSAAAADGPAPSEELLLARRRPRDGRAGHAAGDRDRPLAGTGAPAIDPGDGGSPASPAS